MEQVKYKPEPPVFVSEPVEKLVENVFDNKFYIHTLGYVELLSDHDFTIPLPNPNKTQELWYYSVPSINALFSAHLTHGDTAFLEHGCLLLRSFLLWLHEQSEDHAAWKDEHAVANRLRVVTYASWAIMNSDLKNKKEVLSLFSASVVQHAKWVASDEHYIWNNHGLMMDKALIEASCLPKDENLENDFWRATASRRIQLLLKKSFDKNGCCTENSPAYHLLNERLFYGVSDLARQLGALDLAKEIEEKLKAVTSVSGLFVRQDGTYATVGDSEIEATHWINKPGLSKVKGVGVFPGAGFFLYKTEEMYLSMKCGGSSYSHRHLDDTSITLFYKEQDIIIDAGLFDFEVKTSKISRWFRSTKAHSGIFVEKSDDTRYADFENPDDIATLHTIDNSDQIGAVGESNLSDLAKVTRHVRVLGSKVILNDNVISNSANSVKWRQQFLLGPSVEIIDISDDKVIGKSGDVLFSIRQNGKFKIELEHGFFSRKFGEKQDTQTLVFSGESADISISTIIDMEPSIPNSSIEDWNCSGNKNPLVFSEPEKPLIESRKRQSGTPDVSVIIPAYNAATKIGRCLGSLRRITLPQDRYEVILVDDCSSDGTYDYLQAQAGREPHWRVLRMEENSGSPSAPRNKGIAEARGEYVFFLDADDEILPDTLEVHLDHARATNADLVRGALMVENGDKQFPMNRLPDWRDSLTREERIAMIVARQSTIPCTLVRREVLQKNGVSWRSDIRMGEDTLFLVEALMASDRIEYIDHLTYIYVKTASFVASSTQSYGDRELRNHLIVWRSATQALAKIGRDYVSLRLQIGLQTTLRSMIFVNRGDISDATLADFFDFLRDHAGAIDKFTLSKRLKDLIETAKSGDAAAFRLACRPRLLIAGHDLKFITGLLDQLSPFYDIRVDEWKGHDMHDPAASQAALDWAELIWCEWLLGNAVWYAQHCRPDQILVMRMHRFELGRDFGERLEIKNVNAVVAVSTLFLERMLERFPIPRAKARLLPNYIDTKAYTCDFNPERRFTLGVIGILPSRKGFDRALSLLARLRREDPRYTLDVYSKRASDLPWLARDRAEMEYYEKCDALIAQEGMQDAVRFLGHVGDLPVALARNGTGIILSQSQSVREFPCFESFHLAVADGFASGAASLVQYWEGAEFVWPEHIVLPDEDAMVERILSWRDDPEAYLQEAKAGAEFVTKHYGVDHFVEGFRKIFRESY